MYLLILLIAAIVIGYFLSKSRFSGKVDETAQKVTSTSRTCADWAEDRWLSIFSRNAQMHALHEYILVKGASNFPDEFKDWFASLSETEEKEFQHGLKGYTKGLVYDLETLVEGGLDDDPFMRQVFVEALVIYSQAYRKAKQAHQRAKEAEAKKAEQKISEDGKKPNKKKSTNRKGDKLPEATESASMG